MSYTPGTHISFAKKIQRAAEKHRLYTPGTRLVFAHAVENAAEVITVRIRQPQQLVGAF